MGFRRRIFRYCFPELMVAETIRRICPTSGIVLMYHEVLPDDIALPAWTIVRESDFRLQMNCLRMYFDIITLKDAVNRVSEATTAKRPFAVVTFDDGYQGNATTVLPIMKEIGLPFTVYAATKAIVENGLNWYDRVIGLLNFHKEARVTLYGNSGPEYYTIPPYGEYNRWVHTQKLLNRMKLMAPEHRELTATEIATEFCKADLSLRMLTEEELKRLAMSDCVTIGCHTHGHELLDQISLRQLDDTLNISINHITRITGTHPRHFSYPNGNFSHVVQNAVHSSGFETAVTTLPGFWSGKINILEIPRISIGRFETINSFRALISGWM
jgi:peptidoglycan/xylan/chitin deacetylase (PgdA/CDA1 family)